MRNDIFLIKKAFKWFQFLVFETSFTFLKIPFQKQRTQKYKVLHKKDIIFIVLSIFQLTKSDIKNVLFL